MSKKTKKTKTLIKKKSLGDVLENVRIRGTTTTPDVNNKKSFEQIVGSEAKRRCSVHVRRRALCDGDDDGDEDV